MNMIDHPILHLDRNKSNSFDNAASPGGQSMVVHCPHSRSILVIAILLLRHRFDVKCDEKSISIQWRCPESIDRSMSTARGNFTLSNKEYGCKWTWLTIQFYTWTQIKVKKQQCFYCCSTFHSHRSIFSKEYNS
jgi:hypothetical protein